MPSYSDKEILEEIRRIADLLDVDEAPSRRTFDDRAELSSSTVVRRFGSWGAAVNQAGLDPHRPPDRIPRDELVAELHRLRDELDQIPTADQMDDHGVYAYITYYERFGSWVNALEEVFGEVPDREWEHVSDAELIAELHRLAEENNGERPTTTDVQKRGAHAVTTYRDRFGSWRDALEAAGFEPPPSQGVTTAELLAELRRLHDELNKKPTTTVVREHGTYSLQTYYTRFDSWDDVLNAAFETVPDNTDEEDTDDGPSTKIHTDEELLEEIRRVADIADADGAPTITQFDEHSDIAHSTIHRRFGSWNEAVAKTGFKPNAPNTSISKADLAAELQRLREELGHLPTAIEMNEHGAHWTETYENHYGSWTTALCEIFDDITVETLSQFRPSIGITSARDARPHVSDETLLQDLRTLADELGRSPTSKDMREHGSHSARTYMNRFGSWNDALEAADIDPPDRNRISDAELITDLHRLRDELGERPTSTDVARDGEYGLATYQRRFGSWGEAAAAAFNDTDV